MAILDTEKVERLNKQDDLSDIPDYVDVVIIGAGPTGLSLACQLARENVNFVIFDLKPKVTEERNILLLHSKTLEFLNELGVSTVRHGHIIKSVNTYVNSNLYSSMKLGPQNSTCLAIDQVQLEEFLNQCLESLGYSVLRPYAICKIETCIRALHTTGQTDNFPSKIMNPSGQQKLSSYIQHMVHSEDASLKPLHSSRVGNEPSESETVSDTSVVHIKKVSDLGEIQNSSVDNLRCKYVIGCDGMSSCVRKASDIDFEAVGQCTEYLFAEVSVSWGITLDLEAISVLQTMQGGIVTVPLVNNRWHIFCSRLVSSTELTNIITQRESPDFQELQQILNTIAPNTILENVHSAHSYTTCPRLGTAFKKNDILILGDAAHLFAPILGYGVNAGIMDVLNLSWKLAAVLNGANAKLLDTYNSERREIIKKEFGCFPNPVFDALTEPGTSFRFLLALLSLNLAGLDNFGECLIKMISQAQSSYTTSLLNSENKLSRNSPPPGSYFRNATVALVPIINDSNLSLHDSPTTLSRFMQDFKHTLVLAIYVFPPGTKAQTIFGCRRNEEAVRWNVECLTRLAKLAKLLMETLKGSDYETSELTVLWLLCGLVNLRSQSNSVALENIKDHVPHRLKQFFNQKSHLLVDSENEFAETYQLRLSAPDSFSGNTNSGAFVLFRPDGYICSNGYAGDSKALSATFDYAFNWFSN